MHNSRIHTMRENMGRRLRVLYVDYSIGFGGSTKSLALMLRELPDVEAMIVTTQGRELVDTWMRDHRVWSFRRVVNYRTMWRVHSWVEDRLPALLRWGSLKAFAVINLLVTVMSTFRLAWIVRRQRVDLIHLNNGFTPPEAFLAARLTDVPCVVHLRGFSNTNRKSTSREKLPIAHVIAVSQAVATALEQTDRIPSERITAIHDPVDLERAVSAPGARDRVRSHLGIEPHHVAVGIFGRVIHWKGQHVFVEAAIRAMRDAPELRAVIVGDKSDGSDEYVDRILATIRESGMEDHFVLAGYTPDVEAYYAAMDVVVHASVSPEPFGMVVPEAMAAGRAVIAADAGGPREVVTHGVDGLLVSPGDVDALAAAILRLARDPAERARLARNAYRSSHQRFSIRSHSNAVREVYDTVFGGTRHPGIARQALSPVAGPQ